jgi:hypothetical protein
LYDSGGCSTIGHRGYFLALKDKVPEIIAAHHILKDVNEADIPIGGIGGGIAIKEILEVWMPYRIGEDHAKLSIGLADEVPITLIIGLPFIIAAETVPDYRNGTCRSEKFGDTWSLVLKKNHRKSIQALEDQKIARGRVFASSGGRDNSDVDFALLSDDDNEPSARLDEEDDASSYSTQQEDESL